MFLFREKYELMKQVRAGASIQSVLNKYRITVHMWNQRIDSEPEMIEKVKKYDFAKKKIVKNEWQYASYCTVYKMTVSARRIDCWSRH